jgi:NADH-quinone oxidoreductase subunit E
MQPELEKIFTGFEGKSEEIIPLLQAAQAEFGYLPDTVMAEIAKFVKVPQSQVYGVATFYAQFRFSPIGRQHVLVCRGTACHVQGATKILEEIKNHLNIAEGAATSDGEYSLETVGCIGCCSLAPCIMVNGKVVAKVTPKKVPHLLPKEGI